MESTFKWDSKVWRVYFRHVLLQALLLAMGWVSLFYGWGLTVHSWPVVLVYLVVGSLFYPMASAWAKSPSKPEPLPESVGRSQMLADNVWLQWLERREALLADGKPDTNNRTVMRAQAWDCVNIQRALDKRDGFNVAIMSPDELLKAFIIRHSAKQVEHP